jgi:Zn-dependent protease with chaperone function
LTITVLLVGGIIVISSTLTLSLAVFLVLIVVGYSYLTARTQHERVIQHSYKFTARSSPALLALAGTCKARIQPGRVEIYVAPASQLNAYTFGISGPKVIVMYSSLFELMDGDELRFILGHEMGHVSLGHTWLNSLVGGMAGIPTSFGASMLLNACFLWWNRACEYSADRAGLLACDNPAKAVSALVKLAVGGQVRSQVDLTQALKLIEARDAAMSRKLEEMLSSHPMIARRVQALQGYAKSSQYKRLQALVNQNRIESL